MFQKMLQGGAGGGGGNNLIDDKHYYDFLNYRISDFVNGTTALSIYRGEYIIFNTAKYKQLLCNDNLWFKVIGISNNAITVVTESDKSFNVTPLNISAYDYVVLYRSGDAQSDVKFIFS